MRPVLTIILCIFLMNSCKQVDNGKPKEILPEKVSKYDVYGKEFDFNSSHTLDELQSELNAISASDSLNTIITARVNSVCQAKGCWMKLDLKDGQELMVKFKDYGFFVPKDITGKDVVVNGKAFVSEVSVEEQRHYALDAGKSEEEIQAITEPKKTYSFEADGVLIQ